MLFNPQWTKTTETKADPLSLDSLIAWLEEQDGDRRYTYISPLNCLLAQYFKAKGFRLFGVGGWSFDYWRSRRFWFAKLETLEFSEAFSEIASETPRTFGAALDRARSWRDQGAV